MQQPVGATTALPGTEVIRAVQEDKVDVRQRDERLDADRRAAVGGRRRQLLLGQDRVLAVGDLMALDDLLVRDLLVLLHAEPAVLDARPVGQVHLVEGDALRCRRGVQLDGDGDVPEGQDGVQEGAWHVEQLAQGPE